MKDLLRRLVLACSLVAAVAGGMAFATHAHAGTSGIDASASPGR